MFEDSKKKYNAGLEDDFDIAKLFWNLNLMPEESEVETIKYFIFPINKYVLISPL